MGPVITWPTGPVGLCFTGMFLIAVRRIYWGGGGGGGNPGKIDIVDTKLIGNTHTHAHFIWKYLFEVISWPTYPDWIWPGRCTTRTIVCSDHDEIRAWRMQGSTQGAHPVPLQVYLEIGAAVNRAEDYICILRPDAGLKIGTQLNFCRAHCYTNNTHCDSTVM